MDALESRWSDGKTSERSEEDAVPSFQHSVVGIESKVKTAEGTQRSKRPNSTKNAAILARPRKTLAGTELLEMKGDSARVIRPSQTDFARVDRVGHTQ